MGSAWTEFGLDGGMDVAGPGALRKRLPRLSRLPRREADDSSGVAKAFGALLWTCILVSMRPWSAPIPHARQKKPAASRKIAGIILGSLSTEEQDSGS